MVDLTLLFSAGAFVLLLLLLVGLRVGIPRLVRGFKANIGADVRAAVMQWAFVAETKEVDGKPVVMLRPSPALTQLIDQMAPILINRGLDWAKKNFKMVAPGGKPGEPGALDLTELIKQLPKEWRGIASAVGPSLVDRFLGNFLRGGKATPAASEAANPFLTAGQP